MDQFEANSVLNPLRAATAQGSGLAAYTQGLQSSSFLGVPPFFWGL